MNDIKYEEKFNPFLTAFEIEKIMGGYFLLRRIDNWCTPSNSVELFSIVNSMTSENTRIFRIQSEITQNKDISFWRRYINKVLGYINLRIIERDI